MDYKPAPLTPEISSRDPRIHRRTGIPSFSRLRSATNGGFAEPNQTTNFESTGTGPTGALGSLKRTAYHLLSKTTDAPNSTSSPRPRFASMPLQRQKLPSNLHGLTDIDHNQAGDVVTCPVIDSTNFQDTCCGPRVENVGWSGSQRSTAKLFRSSSGGAIIPTRKGPIVLDNQEVSGAGTLLPASARKPDPRLILSALENIIGSEQKIDQHLNAHDLLAMHQLDQVEFEDRDRVRAKLVQRGNIKMTGQKGILTVLGEPIRKASVYASIPIVLAGREHELPVIVVNSVEELYRTGIYQSNLFRTLPNRARLLELIDIYDSEEQPSRSKIHFRPPSHSGIPNAGFGANTSLHLESTPDVCALLTTYLSSLPEPILPPMFFRPIWDWCGLDDEDMQSTHRQDSFGPRLSHIPLARTYTSPTESTHILVAQLLLQLLPSPNFSLLVYLLAFFSQAALVQEENGVGVSDLSRMFGYRLFGGDSANADGRTIVAHQYSDDHKTRDGETMMSWFLRRWGPLSDGLFDVVEDAKMGLFHRPLARRDSFGKDILPSWLPGLANTDLKTYSGSSSDSQYSNLCGSRSSDTGVYSRTTPPPRIHLHGLRMHSTPKFDIEGKAATDSPSSVQGDGDFEDETLDITHLPLRVENTSSSSTAALDERLLDISMPALLNQTLPASGISPDDHPTYSRSYEHRATQTMSANPSELLQPLQLAVHLEKQLEERTRLLNNALTELTKSKFDASKLHHRVHELEVELQQKHNEDSKIDMDNEQLEATIRERNNARDIVSQIKKLVKN